MFKNLEVALFIKDPALAEAHIRQLDLFEDDVIPTRSRFSENVNQSFISGMDVTSLNSTKNPVMFGFGVISTLLD
ncbi:hypothetical protein BIY26_21990 [Brenneria goodwinii]|uniref:Uncharacterized protein n=1 Tax=Brenneria goodwinii TaxID=1109412 RepID=A0AAE8EME7_9GAMM|nr:hypothetical protein AWC36_10995 [Brenneria goodwinii]RLM16856.1 hypothetical protein BIY26_21990 [Brenneria goodwinii]